MNQVLLAPQFGVGRAKLREPDEPVRSPARDVPAASLFAPPAGGPQVIVKRRRVLEVPKPGSDAEQAATGPVKAPKVYKVAQVAAVAPMADAREEPLAAAPVPVQEAPPAAPKLRRRRDPSRQPTLVQHVVFEPAPVQAAPAEAIGTADLGGLDVLDGLNVLDAKQLREALAVLDAELQRVARCEAAARSLDVHLKQLRVGAER
jgi:hypothetical protein